MKSTIALDTISDLVESAIAMTAALQELRDKTTEEEWEAINDNPLIYELIASCGDIEDCV